MTIHVAQSNRFKFCSVNWEESLFCLINVFLSDEPHGMNGTSHCSLCWSTFGIPQSHGESTFGHDPLSHFFCHHCHDVRAFVKHNQFTQLHGTTHCPSGKLAVQLVNLLAVWHSCKDCFQNKRSHHQRAASSAPLVPSRHSSSCAFHDF